MTFGPQITRRDFLNGALIGVGGVLLGCRPRSRSLSGDGAGASWSLGPDWYGYGGVGDYRFSHGNTPEAVEAAHRLRDGGLPVAFDRVESTEDCDLVIVGGGFAGLGAALEFSKRRKPGQTCLVLDNHPIFGGEAKENEFDVGGIRLIGPQGSNGFFLPPAAADPERASGDARYYAELGVPRAFRFRDWPATAKPLRFSPDNYEYLVPHMEQHTSVGHFFRSGHAGDGTWAVDIWERRLANTPLAPAEQRLAAVCLGPGSHSGARRHVLPGLPGEGAPYGSGGGPLRGPLPGFRRRPGERCRFSLCRFPASHAGSYRAAGA